MSLRRSGKLQAPVVVDVGCSCRTPRLLSSLVSSLKSHARGLGLGGKQPKQSPRHASSAWSSSTATAFTPSAATSTTATAASSLLDYHASSWGPATYPASANALHEGEAADDAEARRQRRRRRRRQRQRKRCRREQRGWPAAEAVLAEETTAVAVEVDSAAPYEDFRDSMVAMVREKEMYAWEDLNALLHQFLALNSPRHHALILGAFADLWAPHGGLFCPPSPCYLL